MFKLFALFKIQLIRAAISKALERNSPSSIPLSGWDRLQVRDYYTVHLGNVDDEHAFFINGISKVALDGHWWWRDVGRGFPASVPNSNLPRMALLIKHYCRELEVDYRGSLCFMLGRLCGWSWIILFCSRFQTWFYNRKHLVRDEQYKLLRNIYDQTLHNRVYSTSAMDYMTERYGLGWGSHPSNQEVRIYYGLILDALAEAGDLQINGRMYSLSPQAISTLANHEEDNRRHVDAVRLQKVLHRLTFALVVVGLLQAWVAYQSS